MHKLERYLYPALLLAALAYAGCRTSHPKSPEPAYYGRISVNDTVYLLDRSQDTTILHRTSYGKVWVYQLENYTTLASGRRISVVFSVELDSGEQLPHDRVTAIVDGQADEGGHVYYQSSPRPAAWLRWGINGDRIICRRSAGKLVIDLSPVREWNGRRRILRGYITQP